MQKLGLAGLICLIVLIANFQTALAHETITVGDYEIEVGWINEPPVAGQQNAIVINVINTATEEPVEDVSSLSVAIHYGDQEKTLTLQPLGEDTPGRFLAPVLPTIPGQYTVMLGGQLGDISVDAHAEPEEVGPADTLQFPAMEASQQNTGVNTSNWVSWFGVFLGLVGIGLGVTALRKKS